MVENRGKRRVGDEAEGVVAAKMEVLLAIVGYTIFEEDLPPWAHSPGGAIVWTFACGLPRPA